MNLTVFWHFLSLQLKTELAEEKEQHKKARSDLAVEKAKRTEQIANEVDKCTKKFAEEKTQLVMALKDFLSRFVKEGIDQVVTDISKLQIEPGDAADDTPRYNSAAT